MEQQVSVYDEENILVGTTFRRRARQLVLKKRANWIDESCAAICLTSSEQKEETSLDRAMPFSDLPVGNHTSHIASGTETIDMRKPEISFSDDELMRLARKRVRNKRNLITHIVVYISTAAVLFVLITGMLYGYSRNTILIFYMGAMFAWGIFIVSRFVLYFLPFFKNSRHFGRRDPVKDEYLKLKIMDSDRVAAEYEQM